MKINLVIAISGLAILTACAEKKEPAEAAAAAKPAVPVKVLQVTETEIPAVYEASGTVKARASAAISSKVMGYVREVRVGVGDRVGPGQVLAVLDSRDLDAAFSQSEAAVNEAKSAIPEADNAVAAAKANLELAQVTFQRMKDLYDKRSVSNQEFDEASAKLRVAQANLAMAQSKRAQLQSKIAQAEAGYRAAGVNRGYAQITSPFEGVVTEKTVEPGNLAAPGTPLLTIERQGAYRLEAPVEESKLPAVRMGQPVTVSLEALGRDIQGRVAEIVPAVDPAARSFMVKIDLPSLPQLRSGIFGRARFAVGKRQAIVAPEAAVQQTGQLRSILVADAGQARARLVTVGQKMDGNIEILSGLNPGDAVIFPVPAGVSDGAKVEVRP